MSKVTITIEDGEEFGTVNAYVEFDPPLDREGSEDEQSTPAETLGADAWAVIRLVLDGEGLTLADKLRRDALKKAKKKAGK